MKSVRFLSAVVLICNVSFLLFVLLNQLGIYKPAGAIPGTVERIPLIREMIIILGFSSVFVNVVNCIAYVIILVAGRRDILPKWIAITNTVFIPLQVYYFLLT